MKTIVIAGGTSGIGRRAAQHLVTEGHHVLVLGRSQTKGADAVASFGDVGGRATYLSVDLATHAGVIAAAEQILELHPHIDVLLHTSGVLVMEEDRTADGLHPMFAVNTLSRYHLTQRLLPALRAAEQARVVMMTSKFPLTTEIDFERFPHFQPFSFRESPQLQMGNQHYAAHLARNEPDLLAGTVNAGVAKTDIWRRVPWYVRAFTTVLGPFLFNTVEESASIPVAAANKAFESGTHWASPGKFERQTPIQLDPSVTDRVIATFAELVGL